MADAIAITKADGENITRAERARAEFSNALHLFPPSESGWIPRVITCSSKKGYGINDVWDNILEFIGQVKSNGFFERNRKAQACYWMHETINQSLRDSFYHDRRIQTLIKKYEKLAVEGEISPFAPAKALLEKYFKRRYIKLYYKR